MRFAHKCMAGAVAAATMLIPRVAGGTYYETGDAGDMPLFAAAVVGAGPLDLVRGSIDGSADADMFAIYISDPAGFSATTDDAATVAFDTQLFLFDIAGVGLAANDDILNSSSGYNPRSRLSAGSPLLPTVPGVYYLAISGWDRDPHSVAGAIFTDDTFYTGTVGPGGVGGAQPISGWDGDGAMNGALGAYAIRLTGATFVTALVPEPGTLALLACGAISAAATQRDSRRRQRFAKRN